MEAHLSSSVQDGLLESLNFRPPGNSAGYVLESRKVKFFAESSDTFSVNSRVIRFRLVDQGFWEPGSSKVTFTLFNKDSSNALAPVTWSPLAMFSRIRVFMSGIQIENWDYVGESAVMMDRLKGAARRLNDSVEGHILTAGGYADTCQAIPASGARTVQFSIPCGVTSMSKWVPLSLVSGGLVIEMELGDAGQAFDVSSYAANWEIKDVSLMCNIHTIDSSLSNSYAKHILSGNSINFHTKSMVTTKHLVTNSSFTIPIVRGYSRLCQVYLTMHKTGEKAILQTFHPVNNQSLTTANDNCTLQLSVGSRRFPERPMASVAEHWLRLREAAGVFYGESDLAITPADFVNRKAIFGFDLEKVGHEGASHSGISTKNGDILTISVQNSGLGSGGSDYVLVHLVFENLFALRDGSVDVYD